MSVCFDPRLGPVCARLPLCRTPPYQGVLTTRPLLRVTPYHRSSSASSTTDTSLGQRSTRQRVRFCRRQWPFPLPPSPRPPWQDTADIVGKPPLFSLCQRLIITLNLLSNSPDCQIHCLSDVPCTDTNTLDLVRQVRPGHVLVLAKQRDRLDPMIRQARGEAQGEPDGESLEGREGVGETILRCRFHARNCKHLLSPLCLLPHAPAGLPSTIVLTMSICLPHTVAHGGYVYRPGQFG